MENAEEVYHFLEEFSKRKPKIIPQELNDYLAYVARTGDPVYQWSLVKSLFKEKLLNVITDFYETTPSIEIPPYPNVDPFNYDLMKNSLLERLDTFTSAPFTVQRICELLTYPRKQYNRVDKFMRAIEKNILVVSTREPGTQRHVEPENGEPMEPIVNGSDNNSEYNVDVEMEDMSWKENSEHRQPPEPQPSSSDTHISVDDIEARLQAKQDVPMDTQEKTATQYESVTPPELNVSDEQDIKINDESTPKPFIISTEESNKTNNIDTISDLPEQSKIDIEMKTEQTHKDPLGIPEIKVEDAEMTEQRLIEESKIATEQPSETNTIEKETPCSEDKIVEIQPVIDENSSDSNLKEEIEPKIIPEVPTSSEESSSSSDNTDGNSNSPKPGIETNTEIEEDKIPSVPDIEPKPTEPTQVDVCKEAQGDIIKETPSQIQSDNYSISDVHSELPQPPAETPKPQEIEPELVKEGSMIDEKKDEELTAESNEISTETTAS